MDTQLLITCILSSSVAVAVITTVKELVIWKMNRRATVEDKETNLKDKVENLTKEKNKFVQEFQEFQDGEETMQNNLMSLKKSLHEQLETSKKLSENVKNIQETVSAQYEVLKAVDRYILGDHIKTMALEKLKEKTITFDDRKKLHDMWDLYHYGLGANGDLNSVMNQIDNLPLDLESEDED